ncbi:MAG TPA: hypothetical protein VLE99_05320 [Candidatus Saccharimonadales bacterium]|nr:hypothetical protein [Candidatus Saccharimonadales bacterium]
MAELDPNAPLTREQRDWDIERILLMGSLLLSGADIGEYGQLVITLEQYIELGGCEPYGPQVHQWLDMNPAATHGELLDSRLKGALHRQGFGTLRAVLASGLDEVVSGDKTTGLLMQALLGRNPYEIAVCESKPSIDYVAALCRNLDEVPGRLVHSRIWGFVTLQQLLDRSDEPNVSFRDVAEWSVWGSGPLGLGNDGIRQVLGEIRIKAVGLKYTFEAARLRLVDPDNIRVDLPS